MPTISRRLASAGTADPGDLKSPSLPAALQFAPANQPIWGNHLARLGKSTLPTPTNLECQPGRASRTCLLNSGLPEKGVWCESTAFRHSCARSSKRAGGLIPRIALDQCRVPERYRTRVPFESLILRPHSSNTERARPKRQVAGESPAGDTSFSCGCGSTAECGRAKAETTVRLRSPAPFLWGVELTSRALA